jgi:hypothetical protein
MEVLKQTPNLVHCELRLFCSDDDDRTEIVTLSCLESLALNDGGPQPITQYLDVLVTPALRSVRVPARFLGLSPAIIYLEIRRQPAGYMHHRRENSTQELVPRGIPPGSETVLQSPIQRLDGM